MLAAGTSGLEQAITRPAFGSKALSRLRNAAGVWKPRASVPHEARAAPPSPDCDANTYLSESSLEESASVPP